MLDPLIFTPQAATKVWELIQEEGNFNLKLRVYVTGGGCSGFQYGFTFDEVTQPDDTVVQEFSAKVGFLIVFACLTSGLDVHLSETQNGSVEFLVVIAKLLDAVSVRLLVDPLSFQYLVGAEIDYKEDIEGEQFIIRNPNAKTTCGCGSSFTTE